MRNSIIRNQFSRLDHLSRLCAQIEQQKNKEDSRAVSEWLRSLTDEELTEQMRLAEIREGVPVEKRMKATDGPAEVRQQIRDLELRKLDSGRPTR